MGLCQEDSDASTVLKVAMASLRVASLVAYRFDPRTQGFVAIAGTVCPNRALTSELDSADASYLRQLHVPVQHMSGDKLFGKFPETLCCVLERIWIAPLLVNQSVRGLLTVGCAGESCLGGEQLELALAAARLLTAIFHRDELERNLAARKLVERAKGILQRTRRLTEEEAYLELRSRGRCRQVPMADVARDIIDAELRVRTARSLYSRSTGSQ
jgi:hypothetical protein